MQMKLKLQKTDGTVIDFEGTVEELNALMAWVMPIATWPIVPTIPVAPLDGQNPWWQPNPFTYTNK
jgi:hypothetical protein